MIEVATRNSPERRVLPAVSSTGAAVRGGQRGPKPKQKPKVPPKPKMSSKAPHGGNANVKSEVRVFQKYPIY